MGNHDFNFEGGEILSKVGASWLVSYAYCEFVDSSHRNWSRLSEKSVSSRKTRYLESRKFHVSWLQRVTSMNDALIATNHIGLSPAEIKRMASEVLEIIT